MIEIVYAVCAFILMPTTTDVVNYHLYIDSVEQPAQVENVVSVCGPLYRPGIVEYMYSVDMQPPGYEAPFTTQTSGTLTVQWVPDADFDDDGVVGMSDFGQFGSHWGTSDPKYDLDKSGTVGFSDFGLFGQRWGECLSTNHVKVVPCGS